ncbi:MAG: ABC transporter ATP-binding protein [Chthoniobacteraceae bacterium]|nr:ABC transporter ATP-binding protein [Chthoniobacteraceae bacterium]
MAQVSLTNIQAPIPGGGALQDVNLEARDREFLVLAGPSGCGNSTVLRLLAGLERPSGGELSVGGRVVNALPPRERGVALVLPKGGLFPQITGAANIALGLKGRHFSKAEVGKRAAAAAEVTGAGDALALRPAAMTAGQRLRVALARAIVGQPKAILLDDPLAALDAETRAVFRAELVKWQERLQTTFLYATADPLEAMTLGHRAALFEAGRLRGVDAPRALYERPANRFVAGFLGRPKMNFLAGRVQTGKAGVVFKETEGTVELALEGERAGELAGREMTLGFRPEDVRPALETESPKARGGRCQGLVEHVEATGADVFYTVQTGGHDVVIRGAAGEEPRGVGRRMAFDIALEKVHLFDAASGERIPLN